MALLRFFKTTKNQRYNYIPRYWDPNKEELEKRMQKHKKKEKTDASEADIQEVRARISGSFRRGGYNPRAAQDRKGQMMRSNIILLMAIVFLVIIAYQLLTVFLPRILEMIEG